VGERLDVPAEALPARGSLPAQEGLLGDGAERHHCPDVGVVEQRVEPAFAVAGRALEQLFDVVAPGLAVDGVEEGVDHHVGALDPELPEKALDALAGLADQAAVGDRLVLAGVLAQHQDPRAAVEPAAVEDRPPLDPEAVGVLGVGARVVARQGGERLAHRAGIERLAHLTPPPACRTKGQALQPRRPSVRCATLAARR
jgi:hypothetical protein